MLGSGVWGRQWRSAGFYTVNEGDSELCFLKSPRRGVLKMRNVSGLERSQFPGMLCPVSACVQINSD